MEFIKTNKTYTVIIGSILVLALILLLRPGSRSPSYEARALADAEMIRMNQEERSTLKPQIETCERIIEKDKSLEADNTFRIQNMNRWGFDFNWSTNEMVPLTTVVPKASAQEPYGPLVFDPTLIAKIGPSARQVFKAPVRKDPKDHLAEVCGDARCTCINNAIFKHDSSWATAGVGKRALNPCNMRVPSSWKPSVPMRKEASINGTFAKFNTLEDGITACVELYERLYKHLPAEKLVARWTNGEGNVSYQAAVSACYM